LAIAQTCALADLPRSIDTIVVSGGSIDELEAASERADLICWLAANASRARRVASVCTGAFLLAAAGLLDGRRATTHWASCAQWQERCPLTRVIPNAIYGSDGNVYPSAGVTAGIDLALALVEQDVGPRIALAVARDLVIYLRRPGGQSQFSAALAAQAHADSR